MMKRIVLAWLVLLALASPVPASPATTPARNAFGTAELDASIEAKAKEKNIPLSGPCDDTSFLRRLSLDLTGVIPTPQDVEAFLLDTRADKRTLKIEELLARPEFDSHWATQMRSFMMGKAEAKAGYLYARKGIEEWLEERLRAKDGYDKIVSQLISAEGPFIDNPAVGFLMKKDATPEDLTARTGKVFLGAQIQCAQCHDHPFEKWSRKDFYGMVSFFARTRTAPVPEPALELIRKGVPPQMVRMLLLGGNGKGPLAGKFGKAGKGKGPFANMSEEERMRRMMRRLGMVEDGMGDGGMAGPGMTGTGTGTGGLTAQPAEILEIAQRIRKQMEDEMGKAGPGPDLAADPAAKAKRAFRPIPVVFDAPRGEAVIPDPNAEPPENPRQQPKGEQVAARFLDGTTPSGDGKRRQQLAAWMTSPKNPYFARAAVNRFFAMLTGQPLVSPVDNVVAPSEKALGGTLDKLAEAFVESGHDLRWLCRTVVSSRSYQRDLAPAKGAEKDRLFLTHATPRQLSPEQLIASFLQAFGATNAVRNEPGGGARPFKDNYLRQFVFTFENDEGAEVEVFHETIPQALMLMNSRLINGPVQAERGGGTLVRIASASSDPKERIDRLYLATLSRHARPEEIAKLSEHIAGRAGRVDPDMPGMDDPAVDASEEAGERPRGAGRRFGRGKGMGQMGMGWRERFGRGPGGVRDDFEGAQASLTPIRQQRQGRGFGGGPDPWTSPGERQAYEDIFWSLVSCSEFLYNH